MRAVRYEGPERGVVLTRGAASPEPREGEAVVRPVRCAIAFEDVRLPLSKPVLPPVTMGREFVGVVEQALAPRPARERGVSLVGKRVVASPTLACGECDLCQRGLAGHCRRRAVLGLVGRDGCFADRLVVPIRHLHAVPDEVDDDRAAFAVALASAIHCVQKVRIEGKPFVTVLGDGCIGLLCAQLMARLNASVRIVGRSESRLELASKWGIKHRLERDIGRRADQDVVVDCSGTAEGLDLAMKLLRPRGTLVLKGPIHSVLAEPWALDLSPIAVNEFDVIGSRCGPIGEAVEALRRGAVDVVSLITRRARLDDAVEALRLASRPEQIRVLLDA